MKKNDGKLMVGLAQLAPVWLNKKATLDKIIEVIHQARQKDIDLLVFGEGYLPGYPLWTGLTDATLFDSPMQKEFHAHYAANAVDIESGDLNEVCALLKEFGMASYLGVIERPADRGGHSLYASLVFIDKQGKVQSVHRKLRPTYDERLTWSPGDGHGLRVHQMKQFTVGGLNCWENWMPLVRSSLYAQGENLHIAVWPGSDHNTRDITRFIARESRSYVVSVSSLMRREDFPETTPYLTEILAKAPEVMTNGGSCVAGPDGEWILEPQVGQEELYSVELDFNRVMEERQNFDPSGHYSRPDVTRLTVNRERQSVIRFEESGEAGHREKAKDL
ncbi:MAG: carbon-nitrogen hydrolase family protein [Lutimonas sp.]